MPTKNEPENYVVIRVYAIHVKKKFGFFRDKTIGSTICIPDTWENANKLVGEIRQLMEKYGNAI